MRRAGSVSAIRLRKSSLPSPLPVCHTSTHGLASTTGLAPFRETRKELGSHWTGHAHASPLPLPIHAVDVHRAHLERNDIASRSFP